MLAIFAFGLHAAWRTGQADPWAWGPPVLVGLALAGMVARRAALWVSLGVAGMALLFCGIAAARWPDPVAATGLAALAILGAGAGWMLRERRWLAGGGMMALALLWRGPSVPIATHAERPALAVVTALPLFWPEDEPGGEVALAAPVDAPIVTLLRTRFEVRPIDDPQALAGSGVRLLLLAQPHGLSPQSLVAIDRWVRDGGTALILADPLLRWPSVLAPGDRRRAPSVHALDPLLARWGVTQTRLVQGETRHFTPEAQLLTLSGAGAFRSNGDPMPIRLSVGRGRAILLGDADLIDDRLWLADPARPLDPRAWSADTPALVAGWLGAALPLDRRWIRAPADVVGALRWALLIGTLWTMIAALPNMSEMNRNKT